MVLSFEREISSKRQNLCLVVLKKRPKLHLGPNVKRQCDVYFNLVETNVLGPSPNSVNKVA